MIVVAGAGPGNPKYLTGEVLEKIKKFPVVIAFGRIGRSIEEIRRDIIAVSRVDETLELIKKNQDRDVLVLASGDPNFFGIVNFLSAKGLKIDQVLPGLSSFQYMMSRLKLSWQDASFLSLHGRENTGLVEVLNNRKTVILTDKIHTPNFISKELCKLGVKGYLYVGFDLSYDEEVIEKISIGDDIYSHSPLAVVVVINEMD